MPGNEFASDPPNAASELQTHRQLNLPRRAIAQRSAQRVKDSPEIRCVERGVGLREVGSVDDVVNLAAESQPNPLRQFMLFGQREVKLLDD